MTPTIKPGYKQTEVGVIPEDWKVCRLDELGSGKTPSIKAGPFGSALTKDTYVESGYKVYGQEQVIRGDYLYGEYFIPQKKFRELESCSVRPGDILLSLVGTLGKLLVIPNDAPRGVINPRLIRFTFDQELISSPYFKFLFESDIVQRLLDSQSQGGTMGVLNAGLLRPFRIQLPTLAEQEAIAEALSDADALIESLEQLIAKKRQIKQGAMQQLLTGKKRLPGYSGEWEETTLGELMTFQNGANADKSAYGSGVPFANVLEVITKPFLRTKDIPGKVVVTESILSHFSVESGDILFNRTSETAEEVGLASVYQGSSRIVFGGFVIRGRLKNEKLSPEFAGYSLRIPDVRKQIISAGQGAVRANIGQTQLARVEITLPSQEEQTAIAQILSNMDDEIVTLESKLAKARQVKQGMMQELLTGKTRLV